MVDVCGSVGCFFVGDFVFWYGCGLVFEWRFVSLCIL